MTKKKKNTSFFSCLNSALMVTNNIMLNSTVLAQSFPASPFMYTRTETIMEGGVSGNNDAGSIDGKQVSVIYSSQVRDSNLSV